MKIDTFLKIGKSHKICEDYILSGTDPIPYIIISDGCSSSKQTDMGARLLCFLAQQYIKFRAQKPFFEPDHDEMGLWVIHNAELVAKQLGLSQNALDATLIVAYKHKNASVVRVHYYGDGCGITSFKKDYSEYRFGEINYTKNAPYYLSYQIDPGRKKLFFDMNQDKIVTTWVGRDDVWERNDLKVSDDTKSVYNYELKPGECLIIGSDGLTSFIKDKVGAVPFYEYMNQFFAFKNFAGEFLKRRANRVLNDLAKENIHNADDLSLGVFLKEDE